MIMSRNAFQKMRVVGIDDGGFQKGITKEAYLAMVLLEGLSIEAVNFAKATVDGFDATDKAIGVLKKLDFDVVMLSGVSFAGFNLIDPVKLYEETRKPNVVVALEKPDNTAVKRALMRHFKDWRLRWGVFEELGPIYEVKVVADASPLFIEVVGADVSWAVSLIKALTVFGKTPEPIRTARLIARGVS